LKIKEVNTGAYIVKAEILKSMLPKIQPHNKQKEYYLTDLVSLCVESRKKVVGIRVSQKFAFGVNDQVQLSQATNFLVNRKIKQLMHEGVIFIQPQTSYVESTVQIGSGTVVYPQNFLMGQTKIGNFAVIEPNCFLKDTTVEAGAQIKFGTHIEKAIVREKAHVGPYARIRPDTDIGENAKVGNFVEMKKVKFGKDSKASHLTYLGDAIIGDDVNIGCGTITCNYAIDKKKYQTIIEDGVFVGSDSQFVAPVKIGKNAIIGSGSTITKDVPEDALAVARGQQRNIEGYAKRIKK
jgi:bifunctional UDP-N-acetylglucosamine pyrophosphorylase/glucosamine-1-phosphate N-acetyltransferase